MERDLGQPEKIETESLVIGAGVIGLACAGQLSKTSRSGTLILLDSHPGFGQETSSRNSEVIHSGVYYPLDSKKTSWCIRGRELLYEFCEKHHIPCAKTGKFLVACRAEEQSYLHKRSEHCKQLGVPHEFVSEAEIRVKEPWIKADDALVLPESGIVDSHVLMATLEKLVTGNGGMLAYRHKVEDVWFENGRWILKVATPEGGLLISTPLVVNAAGLGAAELSNQALHIQRYEHRFCRGRYFTLSAKYQNKFNHLIYPIPPKDGLGIHVTIDLGGFPRIGPDVEWNLGYSYSDVRQLYDCDWETLKEPFVKAVNRYCPMVTTGDLTPGLIGIRPKLFLDGAAYPDFLVENHKGFIHCLGVESPGLTACLAIAEEVTKLAVEVL